MADDDPRRDSFAKKFARAYGYDRRGAYLLIVAFAYVAGCAGIVWLLAAAVSHFRH